MPPVSRRWLDRFPGTSHFVNSCRKLDEFRNGANTDLAHDATAMDLDGLLSDAQFTGDLLVETASYHEVKYIPFTRSKAQVFLLGQLSIRLMSSLAGVLEQSILHGSQQLAPVHGLDKEVDGTVFHGLDAGRYVAVARDEYDRSGRWNSQQACL